MHDIGEGFVMMAIFAVVGFLSLCGASIYGVYKLVQYLIN